MKKVHIGKDVFDAAMERLEQVFRDFDQVILAFSGGKDSGLMLELVRLFYTQKQISTPVSVYHIDYEGGYKHTSEYVERCMGKYGEFEYYHLCMPISASCGISMYHPTWMPWEPAKQDIWLNEPPRDAVTLENQSVDFFETGMADYDVARFVLY